jgi:hypothetical protein
MQNLKTAPALAALLAAALVAGAPAPSHSQVPVFVGAGGGAGIPLGGDSRSMGTAWMTELMAGFVVPGNLMSVRAGVMYGESSIRSMDGMQFMPGGTTRLLGAMGGVMAMPNWDWDWYPYVHAGAGFMNARLHGSTTSLLWAAGAGATMKWKTIDFYVEGRLLQARSGGARGEMVSITSGIRLPIQ